MDICNYKQKLENELKVEHFIIGASDKKKDIYINDNVRLSNTLVIGNKNTGKSSVILKQMAYRNIINKNTGATFVVSSKDLSYELYIMAKYFRRKVVLIKPSVSIDAENLLNDNNLSVEKILDKFDFTNYISKKHIIIIDMEYQEYGQKSIDCVNKLLKALEVSMYKTHLTKEALHFLYVDDSFNHISNLKNLIYYGAEYNLGTTLFLQNRDQLRFGAKDFTSFMESNVFNEILTNAITKADKEFYTEAFHADINTLVRRFGKVYYFIKHPETGLRIQGSGEITFDEDMKNIISMKLKSTKKSLVNKKQKEYEQSKKTALDKNVSSKNEHKEGEDFIFKVDYIDTKAIEKNTFKNYNKNKIFLDYKELLD